MAIEAHCINGHRLKIKDKYAGKRGWCPHCHGLVQVPYPPNFSEDDVLAAIGPAPAAPPTVASDDHQAAASLLGSSFIRQKKRCRHCGHTAPLWFASCSACHQPFED